MKRILPALLTVVLLAGCSTPAVVPLPSAIPAPTYEAVCTPESAAMPSPHPTPMPGEDSIPWLPFRVDSTTIPELLSLADITAGDYLSDAQEKHELNKINAEQAEKLGVDAVLVDDTSIYDIYSDNRGLVLFVYPNGLIAKVIVISAGYEMLGDMRVGDIKSKSEYSYYRGKNSLLAYYYSDSRVHVQMDVYSEREFSEFFADLDGDGKDERFVLFANASLHYLLVEPQLEWDIEYHENGEIDLYKPEDPGTRPLLRVYKGDELIYEQALEYYPFFLPRFVPEHDLEVSGVTDEVVEIRYHDASNNGYYFDVTYNGETNDYIVDCIDWYGEIRHR